MRASPFDVVPWPRVMEAIEPLSHVKIDDMDYLDILRNDLKDCHVGREVSNLPTWAYIVEGLECLLMILSLS